MIEGVSALNESVDGDPGIKPRKVSPAASVRQGRHSAMVIGGAFSLAAWHVAAVHLSYRALHPTGSLPTGSISFLSLSFPSLPGPPSSWCDFSPSSARLSMRSLS